MKHYIGRTVLVRTVSVTVHMAFFCWFGGIIMSSIKDYRMHMSMIHLIRILVLVRCEY